MAQPSNRRICVAGDTHGDTNNLAGVLRHARDNGCSRVLQVGDFGWFPGTLTGDDYITAAGLYADDIGVDIVFVAGNHDNWEHLTEMTANGPRDDDGFIVVADGIRYVPRPHRWEWNDLRFGAMGGAWSIDKARRVPFISWWPNEEPTIDDAETLCAGGPLDVAVFHDAPGAVDLSYAAWSGDDAGGGEATRTLVDMVVARTRPDLVFHGHWHFRHSTRLPNGTRVEGLASNHNMFSGQAVIWDLDDGTVTPTAQAEPTRDPWWQP